MGEYIGGVDGNAVQIAFLPHEDVHGNQADVPLPEQRFGQIAGAVRSDLDVQNEIPLFQPRVRRQRDSSKFATIIPQILQNC